MKQCPFCAEDIQDAAKVCKHCGRDLHPSPGPVAALPSPKPDYKTGGILLVFSLAAMTAGTPLDALGLLMGIIAVALMLPHRRGLVRWARAFVLTFVIFAAVLAIGAPRPGGMNSSAPHTDVQDGDQLELLSARSYLTDSGGYLIVEGEVKNIAGTKLERVAAQSSWYTAQGAFVTSDDALIDFDPLMPGQTSPFKTMTRHNPQAKEFKLHFKRLRGAVIQTRDSR